MATDPEGSTITFIALSGDDAGKFKLNAVTDDDGSRVLVPSRRSPTSRCQGTRTRTTCTR